MCRDAFNDAEWTCLNSSFLHAINADKHHVSFPIIRKAFSVTLSAETGLSENLLGPG